MRTPDPVLERARAVWQRIDAWLAKRAPTILAAERPGATEDELDAMEREIGFDLDPEFRAVHRVHDGAEGLGSVIRYFDFLSVAQALETWRSEARTDIDLGDEMRAWRVSQIRCEPHDALSGANHERGWVPVGRDGCGNFLAVDHAPGPRGRRGQVMRFGVDDVSERRTVEAASLLTFLEHLADRLEAGTFRVRTSALGEELFDDEQLGFEQAMDEISRYAAAGARRRAALRVVKWVVVGLALAAAAWSAFARSGTIPSRLSASVGRS